MELARGFGRGCGGEHRANPQASAAILADQVDRSRRPGIGCEAKIGDRRGRGDRAYGGEGMPDTPKEKLCRGSQAPQPPRSRWRLVPCRPDQPPMELSAVCAANRARA